MSLQIHRAERADRLVGALGDLLSAPLADPFATEIISVPTPGVERWLAQSLSTRLGSSPGRNDGICVGVQFPSPHRLVARVLDTVAPTEHDVDPWRPQRAVWPLLGVIDGCRDEPWAAVLWSYLGAQGDQARAGRRWSTAHHLAGLFGRYASTRPTMLDQWRRGLDVDVDGRPLSPDRVWQAELWRRLRAELGTPSPAERVATALPALAAGSADLDLPERLSVFGASRFDPDHLRVLTTLATERDVHLWLPHPSAGLWERLRPVLAESRHARRRVDDHSEDAVRHRLLAYLGRDSRELQLLLAATKVKTLDHYHPPLPATAVATLLSRLQSDIATDQPTRPPGERPPLAPEDHSVQVHASHGPDRQVEVLRELLVGLLADDPTLEPRDILVMCPDIETFAPLIAATFGLDTAESEAEHPGHRLRVRLADRSLRQTNPLLAIIARLVALAESRLEAATLLDLAATPAVARKFGFRADDLERLHDLVLGSGVRWGLDAPHRSRFGMGEFAQNTWAAGLQRLLLGVTMDETDQHFIGTTLPMDDVDSADVDLVGRLAEYVGRVREIVDRCAVRQSLANWVELFKQALSLLTAVPTADSWQLGHAYAELGRLASDADQAAPGVDIELGLPEVSALLTETFRGRPTRANFRTGTLTMCTMMPMRSVPHRVVCLLGLNDGVFPRAARLDGDDITQLDAWVGDRDSRSEDRQLLLDAIMSARDQLLIIYAGMDPRSGKETAPAVPIGELLGALDGTAQGPDGISVRQAVTVQHPLQPFDERNFTPGSLTGPGDDSAPAPVFSFDRASLRGVRATVRDQRQPDGQQLSEVVQLAPLGAEWAPNLADLLRFLGHPLRTLLRDRAGLSSWRDDDDADEQIPVELDGLERWAIGDRLLRQHLHGQGLDQLVASEWRRGTLPPRMFGQQSIDRVRQSVAELATNAAPFLDGSPERLDVVVDLGTDRLTGSVPRVFGDDIVRVSYSQLSAKARLQSWVELLALSAAYPQRDWRAVTLGKGGTSVLGPVPSRWATVVLADLVDLQRTGLCEPIPFAPKTSAEYARIRRAGRELDPYRTPLEKIWQQERDATYEQFFGAGVTLETLLGMPSVPSEVRGDLGEPSRFGTLARRVFHLLLNCEELT